MTTDGPAGHYGEQKARICLCVYSPRTHRCCQVLSYFLVCSLQSGRLSACPEWLCRCNSPMICDIGLHFCGFIYSTLFKLTILGHVYVSNETFFSHDSFRAGLSDDTTLFFFFLFSEAGVTSRFQWQYLWDVITCPCPWYLFLTRRSSYIKRHYSTVGKQQRICNSKQITCGIHHNFWYSSR